MSEPHRVSDGLSKFFHATFPVRPKQDWDKLSDPERLYILRETAEHLDGCTACKYRIPVAREVLTQYRRFTGEA